MKIKILIICLVVVIASTVIELAISSAPENIKSDYNLIINVDKPEKIETAISNIVSVMIKKDFVMTYLNVRWFPTTKTYQIFASGNDRGSLLSLP